MNAPGRAACFPVFVTRPPFRFLPARAGVVPPDEIQTAVASLTESLRFYTPDVEPSTSEPGIFWLGASGMSLLYPSLRKWARWIVDEIARGGLQAAVIVGFSRFGTYAI